MDITILTNNPKVNIEYHDRYAVIFSPEKDQLEILQAARDRIHLGARLLIHPMMGRIKPHETPYKSVLLADAQGDGDTHMESVLIIEESIAETRKLLEHSAYLKYDETMLADLQYLDQLLLDSGLSETRR